MYLFLFGILVQCFELETHETHILSGLIESVAVLSI